MFSSLKVKKVPCEYLFDAEKYLLLPSLITTKSKYKAIYAILQLQGLLFVRCGLYLRRKEKIKIIKKRRENK